MSDSLPRTIVPTGIEAEVYVDAGPRPLAGRPTPGGPTLPGGTTSPDDASRTALRPASRSGTRMTPMASALAGGDCIDDADALRSGSTGRVLGCVVKAPSTLGTFLRGFRWGHVRQLDRVSRELLAWAAGAVPGDSPLTIDLDSTICETYGLDKEGARRHGYTGQRGYHPLLAGAAGTGEVLMVNSRCGPTAALHPRHRRRLPQNEGPLPHHRAPASPVAQAHRGHIRGGLEAHTYWMEGAADVAEAEYTPFQSEPDAVPARLIVRRVKPTPGSQLALFAKYSYHALITDREGDTLALEADHRRHAEIDNAIRDLKYGMGFNHLPSGRFPANAAWLAVQVMAHSLTRWTARIGLGEQVATTKTLRRRFFSLAGRIARKARRLTLHLPRRWPWEAQFTRALTQLRTLPLPS